MRLLPAVLLLGAALGCAGLSTDGLRLSGRPAAGAGLRRMSGESRRMGALRGGQASNPVLGLWKKYEDALDKEPLKTRMASGFVIGLIGDVICQIATNNASDKYKLDLKRILIFASWGGFAFSPIAAQWYGFIESVVPQDMPVRWLFKVVLDQTIFSVGMTALTFVCLTIVEGWLSGISFFLGKLPQSSGRSIPPFGRLIDASVKKVKDSLYPTLIENWKVWPAVQILNFSVVPLKFQTLFVNCVAIWWNFVLSLMQHK